MSTERLRAIRAAILAHANTRDHAQAIVEALLLDLAGHEDAEPLAALLIEGDRVDVDLPVGEVRRRLRVTLAELAAHDEGGTHAR